MTPLTSGASTNANPLIPLAGKAGAYPTVCYANVLDGMLDPRVDTAFGTTGLRAGSYADLFRDRTISAREALTATAPSRH